MKRIVCLVLALILLVSGCAGQGGSRKLTLAEPASVDIHTEKQQEYLDDSYLFPAAKGVNELSRPAGIVLEWTSRMDAAEYTVRLSEQEDMAQAKEYKTDECQVTVTNLKVATTYYWTVSADGETSEVGQFTTADCLPRNIDCDGVTNMRDLGGWKTADGKRDKQGLIYRSGALAGPSYVTPMITKEGVAVMQELGIVTELDLRNEASGTDPCPVEGVKVIHIPMVASNNFYGTNREQIPKIFEVLANEANYPLVFHCAIGTDRTGYIAFLINALLGVEEQSLYRDYLFSNYGNIGSSRAIGRVKLDYMTRILEYGNGTPSENCEKFLLDSGVKQEHIDALRAIMLGD